MATSPVNGSKKKSPEKTRCRQTYGTDEGATTVGKRQGLTSWRKKRTPGEVWEKNPPGEGAKKHSQEMGSRSKTPPQRKEVSEDKPNQQLCRKNGPATSRPKWGKAKRDENAEEETEEMFRPLLDEEGKTKNQENEVRNKGNVKKRTHMGGGHPPLAVRGVKKYLLPETAPGKR